jgi:hypothetical protein
MSTYDQNAESPLECHGLLLYHFCRMQLPRVRMSSERLIWHLKRARRPDDNKDSGFNWDEFFTNLYALDWYIAVACLDGDRAAWDSLFRARAPRSEALLVDSLRLRALRLYPRDEERQEGAVAEFWGQLLTVDSPSGSGILARYDGQRPLVPWLIRVFQNWHISQLRHRSPGCATIDEGLSASASGERRWHEAFCLAARRWLGQLDEQGLLILGLRLRYRLSQRNVSKLLGVHEGTISRQTARLRTDFLDYQRRELTSGGWLEDELDDLIRTEMAGVLLDDPRLSADSLASLLAARRRSAEKH